MGKWILRTLIVILVVGLLAGGEYLVVENSSLAAGVSSRHGVETDAGGLRQPSKGSALEDATALSANGEASHADRFAGRGEGRGGDGAQFSWQALGGMGVRVLVVALIVALVLGLQALITKITTHRRAAQS